MKRIKLEPMLNIEGNTFPFAKRDKIGRVIRDAEGNPVFEETIKLPKLLWFLVRLIPLDKLTAEDVVHASRFYDQMARISDNFFEIEEAEHDWIKEKLEAYGLKVFGIDTGMVRRALENFDRPHEKGGDK